MSLQLKSLLKQWIEQKDKGQWVLGTIYKTQGPCYRKTGAMMLFGSEGQQLGMLSGGCLESDIHIHARKVMLSGRSLSLSYDGSDEDDISFALGIGCGGSIELLLQPIAKHNDYQQLERLLDNLNKQQTCRYLVDLTPDFDGANQVAQSQGEPNQLIEHNLTAYLSVHVAPPPHILVVGGGIDARPLVSIANQLGWAVSVFDPRPANARREHFLTADYLIGSPEFNLSHYCRDQKIVAVILMSHSLNIDADALRNLVCDLPASLNYIALLGPKNRRQWVLDKAQLSEAELPEIGLYGPAGLDLGGELPESIALSILSQCHSVLHQRN